MEIQEPITICSKCKCIDKMKKCIYTNITK